MTKAKLFSHIGQQPILRDEDQFSVNVLEGLNFVMHLNKNCFRRHLPVHPVSLLRPFCLVVSMDTKFLKKALSLRPNGSCCI